MNLLKKSLAWLGLSHHDRDNFVTNRVTLADYDDNRAAGASSVLGLVAAWACVNLLAGTIGSLPLMVYRTRGGVREPASDHPLYRILHDSPNADQTAIDFWEFICFSIELHGNAYCEIDRVGDRIVALGVPLSPENVWVRRNDVGALEYRVTDSGRERIIAQRDILHIRGPGGNPIGGMSALTHCARTFGIASTIERSAAATFRNGIRSSGAFIAEKPLNKEQMSQLEETVTEKYVGAMNAGRPLLLNNDITWTPISINPEEAQMLESRAFSVEQICMAFGVPPIMIGHGDKQSAWPTSTEQQGLILQKFTLRRRLERIEQALMKQLLSAVDRQNGLTVEFNMDGLLRADAKSRHEVYEIALRNKTKTINEVRRLENDPPVPWGDRPWVQMQDVQLSPDGNVPPPEASAA